VVCFESVSSPVRLVQRLGRTGRNREGRCVLLMSEMEQHRRSIAAITLLPAATLLPHTDPHCPAASTVRLPLLHPPPLPPHPAC
jgi:superfamily II DNA/RNA helicase